MPEINRLIHAYIHYLRTQRRLSPNTQESYLLDLLDLARYSKENGVEDPKSLSRHLLRNYLSALKENGKASASTLARRISSIRGWLKYLESREGMDTSHLGGSRFGKGVKRKKPLPRALTETQILSLLTAALSQVEKAESVQKRFVALRTLTVLELLYSSGLRVTELCHLADSSVDWRSALVRVLGKGSKERIVPIGSSALEILLKYRTERQRRIMAGAMTPSQYLFSNRQGNPLTRVTIESDVRRTAKLAGLELTPHALRHSFATHMLVRGLDLRNLQEMLGHKSLEATQVYTTLTPQALQKTYQRTHPRA